MTTPLLKYLLPLSIVLLIGFNQLLGYAHNDAGCNDTVCRDIESSYASIVPVQCDQFIITRTSIPNTENEKLLIDATESEVEEYESAFSKKFTESSTFFTAVFCILTLGAFFYLKKGITNWMPFSLFRSYRWYIRLCVIRV